MTLPSPLNGTAFQLLTFTEAVILERLCGPVGYFHTGVVTTVLLALRFLRSPILAFGVAYIDVAIILTVQLMPSCLSAGLPSSL